MAKIFGKSEKAICALFEKGQTFSLDKTTYTVLIAGKPVCYKGEPKTDIYVLAIDYMGVKREIKISFKQRNADFLENKTNAERASSLLGERWSDIIRQSTATIKNQFENRDLIFKSAYGRTEKGSIILGWKFELLNKPSGALSGEMALTTAQVIDVYSGTNLPAEKRDAKIGGSIIPNSGVATHILFDDAPCSNLQEVIDSLQTIGKYVANHPKIYFACKALSYRSIDNKYDGNRPLSVYVDWTIVDGKLMGNLCYETPLQQGGTIVLEKLKEALAFIGANNTDDLVKEKIHEKVRVRS